MEEFLEKKNINKDLFFLIILGFIMLTGFVLCKGHYGNILTDFGREMITPEGIADGKVLYKDILCIYFPLAYQINAIGFKLFGTNLSVLEFFGFINAIIFSTTIYLSSKEFLNYKLSCLYAITTAIAVTFNGSLFNFILPYSSSMSYGSTAFIISIFLLIKYIKNNKNICLNLAFLTGGTAFAFKGEYCFLIFILLYVLLSYKPFDIRKTVLNIGLYCLIPILSFGTLFVQGLSFAELYSAFSFMKVFFTTDSMMYHISRTGSIFRITDILLYLQSIVGLLIFIITSLLLFKFAQKTKSKFTYILGIILSAIIANKTNVSLHTVVLPISLLIFLLVNFKKIYSNKGLFILSIAALALNVRTFWSLILTLYGMYTAPLLVLLCIILILQFSKDTKWLTREELKHFITYILISYLVFFTGFSIYQRNKNNTPVKTERGIVYIEKKQAETLTAAVNYIQQYTKPEDKIILLPEGTAINFLTNRKVDLKMHMADRLYFDAIGSKGVIRNLKAADYEMIMIVKGYGLTNFGKPYLYGDDNDVIKYIKNNYFLDWETEFLSKNNRPNTLKCYVKPY